MRPGSHGSTSNRTMSSDSSDEENLELLREATDSQFLDESMYTEKNDEKKKIEKFPSLRKQADEDEGFNFFRVTPEFRSFVAKRLTRVLDEGLSYKETREDIVKKRSKKSYVKLLRQSKVYLKTTKQENNLQKQIVRSKTPKIDEDELKQLSVTPEEILSKKGTEYWSNRSKAPIFRYKQSETGELTLVE